MKFMYALTKDTIKKRHIYEPDDKNAKFPWLQDVRVTAAGDEIVLMEAPSVPIVSIGRAFAHHLRLIGMVLLTDMPFPIIESSHYCKLVLELVFGNHEIRLSVELNYRYKDLSELHPVLELSKTEICDWLFDRIVHDRNVLAMTEMKINYLLELVSVRCSINELEILV